MSDKKDKKKRMSIFGLDSVEFLIFLSAVAMGVLYFIGVIIESFQSGGGIALATQKIGVFATIVAFTVAIVIGLKLSMGMFKDQPADVHKNVVKYAALAMLIVVIVGFVLAPWLLPEIYPVAEVQTALMSLVGLG